MFPQNRAEASFWTAVEGWLGNKTDLKQRISRNSRRVSIPIDQSLEVEIEPWGSFLVVTF